MKTIDDLFAVEIEKVANDFPSVYSKHDVAAILGRLRNNVENVEELAPVGFDKIISKDQINELNDTVYNKLLNFLDRSSDLVDYDSAEFIINYDNKVELENININSDRICDNLSSILYAELTLLFNAVNADVD
jgi:hypothetical protein